ATVAIILDLVGAARAERERERLAGLKIAAINKEMTDIANACSGAANVGPGQLSRRINRQRARIKGAGANRHTGIGDGAAVWERARAWRDARTRRNARTRRSAGAWRGAWAW